MRYNNKIIKRNFNESYGETFFDRGVQFISHYGTPQLRHPTAEEVATLNMHAHVWKAGDRYFKLAHKYYGDAALWWVIAQFNQKPTESHVLVGQLIRIPTPLDRVLEYYGY